MYIHVYIRFNLESDDKSERISHHFQQQATLAVVRPLEIQHGLRGSRDFAIESVEFKNAIESAKTTIEIEMGFGNDTIADFWILLATAASLATFTQPLPTLTCRISCIVLFDLNQPEGFR